MKSDVSSRTAASGTIRHGDRTVRSSGRRRCGNRRAWRRKDWSPSRKKVVREQTDHRPFAKIELSVGDGETKLRNAVPSLDEGAGRIPPINVPLQEWDDVIGGDAARRFAEESR